MLGKGALHRCLRISRSTGYVMVPSLPAQRELIIENMKFIDRLPQARAIVAEVFTVLSWVLG